MNEHVVGEVEFCGFLPRTVRRPWADPSAALAPSKSEKSPSIRSRYHPHPTTS